MTIYRPHGSDTLSPMMFFGMGVPSRSLQPNIGTIQMAANAGYHTSTTPITTPITPPAKTVYMTPTINLLHSTKFSNVPITTGPPGYSATSQPIFPQPSTPVNTGYPPACPAGTEWDDGSASCLPYGYSSIDPTTGNTATVTTCPAGTTPDPMSGACIACPSGGTWDPVSSTCAPDTSAAGPGIYSSPVYVSPIAPDTGLSTGAMWALGLLGAAVVGIGAFAIFRKR